MNIGQPDVYYTSAWQVQLTSGFILSKPQEDGMEGKPIVATKPLNWRRSSSSTLTWPAREESRCPTPWASPSGRWRFGFRTGGWSGKKRTTKTSFRVREERPRPRKRATRTVKEKRQKRKKRKRKKRPRSDFMVLFMVIWLKKGKKESPPINRWRVTKRQRASTLWPPFHFVKRAQKIPPMLLS